MRKFSIFILCSALVISIFYGCQGGQTQAKGEARHVAAFLDALLQKGDLTGAFDMLATQDKAMLGMVPGFYDFLTGKETEAISDELKLTRILFQEFVPVPSNLINYQIGEPRGSGDTIVVPVTFNTTVKNLEDILREHVDPELYEKFDNLDNQEMSFDEKKELIKKVLGQVRSAVKGKTYEMKSSVNEITLIKEDGQWRLSIVASGLMNALGGM